MSKIRAFNALRPSAALTGQVACLPYDVMNRDEAREMAKDNELSFLHVVRADIDLPDSVSEHDERVWRAASSRFCEMRKEGILAPQGQAAYYIYRQDLDGYTRTGLVACLPVKDYFEGHILRHELTRKDKEEDRVCHFNACEAQTAMVFLTYRERPVITELLYELCERLPREVHFEGPDKAWQSLYTVTDEADMRQLEELFDAVPQLYIADGHHRAAAAARIGRSRATDTPQESDWIMAGIFADSELRILPYHRVVRDLNGMSREMFLEACEEDFSLEGPLDTPVEPEQKGDYGLYLDGAWYRLRYRRLSEVEDDLSASLDVSILQDCLLDRILGIKDPRTDSRIDFVGGSRGVRELMRRCDEDMRLAISMPPTSMDELLAVSDHGMIMPPKSTWFEPKLLSGLLIHPYQ